MLRRIVAMGIALSAACTAQYDPCFDSRSIVDRTQLVGLRADPPELVWEPGDAEPSVRIRALVALTRGGFTPVDVSVRLCTENDLRQCATDPVMSLSTDTEHIDATLPVPPGLIEEARRSDALHGYGGVRVLADVELKGSDFDLRSSKLVLVSPHGTVPNGALEIDAIEVGGFGRDLRTLHSGDLITAYVLDRAIAPVLRRDVIELRPLLRPGSVEEYDVVDLDGHSQHLREHVVYSLYANANLFFGDPDSLDVNGGFHTVSNGEEATEPEAPPEHGLVRLRALWFNHKGRVWIVARDGRGGEAWVWLNVDAHDERCCSLLPNSYPDCMGAGPDVSGCPIPVQPVCEQPKPLVCTQLPCRPIP